MKLRHLLITPLLAIAAALLLPSPAQAQVQTSYNPDDLFLGFRTTGGTTDYLIDIGQASTYRDFSGTSFTLSIGNIVQDLVSAFGPNWSTRSDLLWSVSGTSGSFVAVGADPAKTLYATRAEATYGIMSALWARGSSTAQGGTTTKMNSLANAYLTDSQGDPNQSTANSNFGLLQNVSDANSYASFMPGGTTANSGPSPGTSFAAFNPTIEDSFASGAGGTQLDLVRLLPGSGTGEFDGTFTIDGGGDVTFNNDVVSTPEPSSLAILGAGAGLLGLLRRRRHA